MPIDVLGTTRVVVDAARDVRLDQAALLALAVRLAASSLRRPAWRTWPHWWDASPAAASYVLVLDALNFSFWGEPRWRVSYQGVTHDGYWGLALALRRALDAGWPLLDARRLATISEHELAHILRGEGEPPLLRERVACLREVGATLVAEFDGSFARAVEQCQRGALRLVELVARHFRSFRDVAEYDGRPVQLYKRAQILVSDLFGAYDGGGLGAFDDLGALTAFADYKLPQALRAEGVLVYSPALADQVDRRREIAAGHPWEVEIRAATIWAVELLRRRLAERGRALHAFELDWLLWSAAQGAPLAQPYHRTRTIFY